MKKKLIDILIVLMLVMISALGATTLAEKVDFTSENPEQHFQHFSDDEYDLVITGGPISPLLKVSEINWIDGDPALIQEIEQLLDTNYSLKNIGAKIVECSNLSFSITYHWKFIYRPLYRYTFFTTLVDEERYLLSYFLNIIPYLGRSHTVTIEGFNGDLAVARYIRPIKLLKPLAQFNFIGEYEKVTLIK
jgi:hypothetical protein